MPRAFILSCSFAPFFRIVLAPGVGILGRSPHCDYVVDDRTLSRKHAEISVSAAECIVTDLESRNGTFVDTVRVPAGDPTPIAKGEIVRFGSVSFVVGIDGMDDERSDPDADTDSGRFSRSRRLSRARDAGPLVQSGEDLTKLLSEAQRRVFELVVGTGMSEKQIASQLKLSAHTVHNHVRAIFGIFGVHSRTELLTQSRAQWR